MEILSDKEFTEVWHGLLGIPVVEERDYAIPVAQRIMAKYEAGLLSMTEKQYTCLKQGLVPMAHDSPREMPRPKQKPKPKTKPKINS
ncbi:hypothetical protein LMA04_20795 [Pseudescherichia vulneris]|uniref:hypothetical protein n=1 Tax=Pseudescherichia vulneris TaxID=566 RepID=UPI00227A6313|nr:hypothetical protein [Pseudescherichia vulneris]WAH52473.1 hypothetical protein LMA04_20795 [Pseudescherichia vulneris]